MKPSILILSSIFVLATGIQLSYAQSLDNLLDSYWQSETKTSKKKSIKKILAADHSFDEIYTLLSSGKQYKEDVQRGFLELEYKIDGENYFTLVHIPRDYDPTKRYMVYFNLHGGITGSNWRGADRFIDRSNPDYDTRQYINVYPSSWKESPWWSLRQSKNMSYLIELLKATYNVDENRVHIGGVSDGGTGTFYMSNVNPTLWASYSSFIGNFHGLKVLSDNQVYVSNLKYKPFLVINTKNDPLFSPAMVMPYIKLMRSASIDLQFSMLDGYGHDLKWYADHKSRILDFLEETQRNPLPDSIYWETEDVQLKARNHWVIIDKLGSVKGESKIEDINRIPVVGHEAFPRDSVSGRLVVARVNNQINVKTSGVRKFRLLLSPDQFNFSVPITIIVNGNEVYQGMISKDPETLLNWNMKDDDRSMLFGREVSIVVGKSIKSQSG